jgi:hypothetical protein
VSWKRDEIQNYINLKSWIRAQRVALSVDSFNERHTILGIEIEDGSTEIQMGIAPRSPY